MAKWNWWTGLKIKPIPTKKVERATLSPKITKNRLFKSTLKLVEAWAWSLTNIEDKIREYFRQKEFRRWQTEQGYFDIKNNPIQSELAEQIDNINKPEDQKQKKITKVEDPEEDEDVVTKGFLENGKFTGTFTNGDADTVTVVKGLITDIS